jgi:hypothetical protein
MADIYCKLIIAKRKTFDQVPNKFKEEVEVKLRKLGYDTNGDPLPAEE